MPSHDGNPNIGMNGCLKFSCFKKFFFFRNLVGKDRKAKSIKLMKHVRQKNRQIGTHSKVKKCTGHTGI